MSTQKWIGLAGLLLAPCCAAASPASTGIGNVGIATLVFAVAAILLAGLVFRNSIAPLVDYVIQRTRGNRVRRAVSGLSREVLHDFILPGAYGGLAKIDHAVLTAGGILCIRAIPHGGVVFGSEDEAQWTAISGAKRRRFLNPIIQNEGRTRAIRKAVPGANVANLVVFPDNADFKNAVPKNVIRLADLESFVAKFVFGPSRVDDWDAVWLTLTAAALDSEDDRRDYAAQIGFS